jgi:hypothetical protein
VISVIDKQDPERGGSLLLASLLAVALVSIPACGNDSNTINTVEERIAIVDVLSVGFPLTDSVAYPEFNFYAAAVVQGAFYKISITGLSDDADLLVFGADGTFTVLSRCSIDNTAFIGDSAEDCVIRAPGRTLYFGVDGFYLLPGSVGFFTIAVETVTTVNLALSSPLSDTVGRREARIYAVHVPALDDYTISITGLSNDADLYVFGNDIFLNTPATCLNTQLGGAVPENCTLQSGGGVLYFVVDGLFSSTAAVSYTALAAPAMP